MIRYAALFVFALWSTDASAQRIRAIDADGRPVRDSAIPIRIKRAITFGLAHHQLAEKFMRGEIAVVAAGLKAGSGGPGTSFGLVGNGWHGGLSLSEGAREDAVTVLNSFDVPTTYEIRRFGSVDRRIDVRVVEGARGKLVWLGEIELEPYEGPTSNVQGAISHRGEAILMGEAKLSVNGSCTQLRTPIKFGSFEFTGIPPGAYRVEFDVPSHSIPTWWLEFKVDDPPPEKAFEATPIYPGPSVE